MRQSGNYIAQEFLSKKCCDECKWLRFVWMIMLRIEAQSEDLKIEIVFGWVCRIVVGMQWKISNFTGNSAQLWRMNDIILLQKCFVTIRTRTQENFNNLEILVYECSSGFRRNKFCETLWTIQIQKLWNLKCHFQRPNYIGLTKFNEKIEIK